MLDVQSYAMQLMVQLDTLNPRQGNAWRAVHCNATDGTMVRQLDMFNPHQGNACSN